MVQLFLFGPPRLEHNGVAIPLKHRKAWALLAYLAVTAQPHSRDTLATLFWPDYGQQPARSHLRRELARLRELVGPAYFAADREQIILSARPAAIAPLAIDVIEFDELVRRTTICAHVPQLLCPTCLPLLRTAADLYTNHFLAGFTLPDSPQFDEWQFFAREQLAARQGEVLARLATGDIKQHPSPAHPLDPKGSPSQLGEGIEISSTPQLLPPQPGEGRGGVDALAYARRWVTHDPLHEPAHRALIIALAAAGQQAAALRQYDTCIRLLHDELGVPPEAATVALAAAVRERRLVGRAGGDDTQSVLARSAAPIPVPPAAPAHLLPIHLLPTPTTPFVGRQAELAHYRQQLQREGVAVITGMAGMGKTALALALAQQNAPQANIFWHSCQRDEGIDALLWRQAAFLAERGQPELWQLLRPGTPQSSAPLPLGALLDYLAQLLQQGRYLLCLDDLHHLESEPGTAELMRRLHSLAQRQLLQLVVTSRRKPSPTLLPNAITLAGLSLADTRDLLRAHDVVLAEEQLYQLHAETEGNGEFLMLALHALRRIGNHPDQRALLLHQLTAAEDLERHLLQLINGLLSTEEWTIMAAVAILEGYPATRPALEALVDGGRVRDALLRLSEHYLLTVDRDARGAHYHTHALVQQFFYNGLARGERTIMHARAARYYEMGECDPIRAAHHYLRAEQPAAAAQQLTANLHDLIGQGRLRSLRRLLAQVGRDGLSAEQWAAVGVAKGQVFALLGERAQAHAAYAEARQLLDHLLALPILRGELYLGMAGLAEQESFAEAVMLAQAGLDAVGDADPLLAASLHLKHAGFLAAQGAYPAARGAAQAGQALLPPRPHMLQIAAHENLGVIEFYTGQLDAAAEHWRAGLAICRQLPHPFKAVDLLNNLGAYHLVAGNWDEAGRSFAEGLAEAHKLGTVHHRALFQLNLGILCTWQGDDGAAEGHLAALRDHVGEYASNGRYSLADLRLRQGRLTEAAILLDEATVMIAEADTSYQLPELYTLRVRLCLAQGDSAAAFGWVQQALARAATMGMAREEGIARALLGQLLACSADFDCAATDAAFRRSIELLANEPYELARAQAAWATVLDARGDPDAGTALLIQAKQTFARLGAQRDLAQLRVREG